MRVKFSPDRYNEAMKVVDIKKCDAEDQKKLSIFLSSVQAGFPSPADDFAEKELNLHDLVVSCPAATFFVRVEGDSMKDANIFSGDILVVDRSKTASSGKIVIAVVNGEFTVKRLEKRKDD